MMYWGKATSRLPYTFELTTLAEIKNYAPGVRHFSAAHPPAASSFHHNEDIETNWKVYQFINSPSYYDNPNNRRSFALRF